MLFFNKKICASALLLCSQIEAFAPSSTIKHPVHTKTATAPLQAHPQSDNDFTKAAATFMVGAGILTSTFFSGAAFANEIGVENEAPTLFTGEVVEICIKRGPLGACRKTQQRTAENDNDRASKYFRDPADTLKEKYSAAQLQEAVGGDGLFPRAVASSEGNELIEKLKQASVDNKDRNDRIIRAKTLANDLGASFGPLSDTVVILNPDGENYTLLKAPQAMRLKKAGYIKDKRFVTQPTQEAIDAALEAPPDGAFVSAFKGLFGGGGD